LAAISTLAPPKPATAPITLLESNFQTTNGPTSGLLTSTDITSYLNAQYANGAGAGKFIFFRLTPNVQPNDGAFYSFTTGHFAGGRGVTTAPGGADPHIDYTTLMATPEPSGIVTFALAISISAGLIVMGRRKGAAQRVA